MMIGHIEQTYSYIAIINADFIVTTVHSLTFVPLLNDFDLKYVKTT